MRTLSLAVLAMAGPGVVTAAAGDIFAQRLIDELTARHAATLVSIGLHARPAGSPDYVIVAHTNRKAIGKKSDEREDRAAIVEGRTGGPNLLAVGVYDVTLPLDDASGRRIGAVAIKVKPGPGARDAKAEALRLARQYRDALSARIDSSQKLFEAGR
jgi:hypothetical protein